MKKRGMADILVYVLVLAFVVVIASVIFVWSTNFSKSAQEGSESSKTELMLCTSAALKVRHACMQEGNLVIMAENMGYDSITGVIVRMFSDSGAESLQRSILLMPAGIIRIELPSGIGAVKKIEAIQQVGNDAIACKDLVESAVSQGC